MGNYSVLKHPSTTSMTLSPDGSLKTHGRAEIWTHTATLQAQQCKIQTEAAMTEGCVDSNADEAASGNQNVVE